MREAAIAVVTADDLHLIFNYDSTTGDLRWKDGKIAAHPRWRRGKPVTKVVSLGCVIIGAHIVIWCMMTGSWPESDIDHKDRNPHNTVWTNLRIATRSQNAINRHYATTQPYRGVRQITWGRASGRRWRARIKIPGGPRIELGTFATAEEARDAYEKAARKHHGEFAILR
jgi:hypothetical protein